MQRRDLLIGVAAGLASGCGGWHLRGTKQRGGFRHSMLIRGESARNVRGALRAEVNKRGGSIAVNRSTADIVVLVENERFDRRILSVDPVSGKVREIELGLEVAYSARARDGRLLLPREIGTWENDYVFDEGSVLGTNEQDYIIRRELSELAAISIALRLAALDVSTVEPRAQAAPDDAPDEPEDLGSEFDY